jgi:cytochrome c-type biogenesis protein CcsB
MSGGLKSIVEALASLRLAVVTMMALGASLVTATFYEASHGTAAAQRVFYRAPWFAALLGVLAVSVFLSAVVRWPWNRHQIGFVIAHAGILLLLLGSVVSLFAGLDGRLTLAEGETSSRIALDGETLTVALPDGTRAAVPVSFQSRPPAPGARVPLDGSADVVVEEFAANARLDDVWAEGTDGAAGPPALQFTLEGRGDPLSGWLMAGEAGSDQASFGPIAFTLHAAADDAEAGRWLVPRRDANRVAFVATADGRLRYALSTRRGTPSAGELHEGASVPTPWMDLSVRVDRLLVRAVRERVVTRLPATDRSGGPAVRLRLVTGSGAAHAWVAFGETASLSLPDGTAAIGYGPLPGTLPFRVTLLDFDSQSYPGSRMAATYESRVRVEDPQQGTFVRTISMNHPLHHRGYTLFQSSYVAGEHVTSILSVSRAPGLPLVYLGTALLGLGTLWMSFGKRWLARRQGRAALRAHTLAGASVWVLACVAGLLPAAGAAAAEADALREIAIQDGGRVKPLDTFARESARRITGARPFTGGETVAGKDATSWLLSLLADPSAGQQAPVVRVAHADLRARLHLEAARDRYSYAELVADEGLLDAIAAVRGKLERDEPLDPVEEEVATLTDTLTLMRGLLSGAALRVVPVTGSSGAWLSIADLAPDGEGAALSALRGRTGDLVAAAARGERSEAAAAALRDALREAGGAGYPSRQALAREIAYNRWKPFRIAWLLFLAAFLLLLASLPFVARRMGIAGLCLAAAGLASTTAGLWLRTVISGRAPVTNMYETVVFAAWGAVALALAFELTSGGRVVATCASGLAVIALVLADNVPLLDGSIAPLVPVLRDNMWLTLHVLTITLGYAAFFLAMGLGHVSLGLHLFAPGRVALGKSLARFLYRSLQVGTLFLAVGTLLGGVWASYSWGRFWGWDPKETWALIALLGYLAVLHARLAGWLGDFGLALGSIAGFLLVLMAWYGVNYVLGTGLHAYGFGSGGAGWVFAYAALEMLLIVVALARHAAPGLPRPTVAEGARL